MTSPVRIPADVDREDRLIGDLTARQLAVLATAAALLYTLWELCFRVLPAWSLAWGNVAPLVRGFVFAAIAAPIAVAGLALALGRRDGIPLDRLLITAARQRLATPTLRPHRTPSTNQALAPPTDQETGTRVGWGSDRDNAVDTGRGAWIGPSRYRRHRKAAGRVVVAWVPARAVRASRVSPGTGLVELGRDGLALVCAVSPISLTLRSPAEQDQLVAGMARWLHSLTQAVQILVRTTPLDLSAHIDELRAGADRLPHPALEAAAHGHADHLTDLAQHTELLQRRIYLVFHQPTPLAGAHPSHLHTDASGGGRVGRAVRAAEEQLLRRAEEADHLLGGIGLRVTPLDPPATAQTLHAATNPDRHVNPPPPTTPVPGPHLQRRRRPDPPPPQVGRGPALRCRPPDAVEGPPLDRHLVNPSTPSRPGPPHHPHTTGQCTWSTAPTTTAVARAAQHHRSARFDRNGSDRHGSDRNGTEDAFDSDQDTTDLYAVADLDRYDPTPDDLSYENPEHDELDDEQVERFNLDLADPSRQATSAGLHREPEGGAGEVQPWTWAPEARGYHR